MRPGLVATLAAGCAIGVALAGCNPARRISAPAVLLTEIEVREFSGGVAELSLEFEVTNQNNFELRLIELVGPLSLDGHEVGRVQWSGEFVCAKRSTSIMRISVQLAVGEESAVYRSLIDRRPMRKSLHGEVTIARGVILRTFPVHATLEPEGERR